MIAGRLEIELAAGLAKLNKDVAEAKGVLNTFARDTDRIVDGIKGTLASLGIGVGVGGLALLVKGAIDAQDNLNDLSKTTRVAVADLAGLGYAAKQSGSDLVTAAGAVDKLAQNVGKGSEKFAALGVTAKDPLEALKQLADATNALNDPQMRAAVLSEALGKSWEKVAPLLAEGSAKMGEMVEEGKRLSGVTAESAAAADEFNDKLAKLVGNGRLLNEMVGDALPILNRLADDLLALRGPADESNAFTSALAETLRALIVVAGNVGFVLRGIGLEIGGLAAQLAALASGDLKRFQEIGRQMTEDAEANRAAFDKWEAGIMAVGRAAKTARTELDATDQVQRRMMQEASARAREFLASEKRRKEAEAARKAAEDAAKKARVDNAEAELKAQEMFAHDYAEAWKFADQLRTKEYKSAMEERLAMAKAELDAEEMFAKDFAEAWEFYAKFQISEQRKQTDEFLDNYGQMADVAGNFFSDLIMNGKGAFDNLRRYVKQLLADLIAMFAKRWILNIAARGDIWGSAISAGASLLGGSSGGAAGGASGAMSGVSSLSSIYSVGTAAVGAYGSFVAGAQGATLAAGLAGPTTAGASGMMGLGASMAGLYEVLAAIPVWGWIAAAVIAVAAWLGGRHKGGPKIGGSYMSGFNGAGVSTGDMWVPGSDNGRFYTPNQADETMRDMVNSTASGFYDTLRRLGGTGSGFGFGLGFDHDPNGTARSGVSAMLTDANGNILYQQGTSVDDKAVPETLQLEAQRMILVALQNSELPAAISEILNSIVASDASAEDIQRVINAAIEMKMVMDALAELDLNGLDIEALKAWQREGETITQTFQRVAQQWSDLNNLMLTDDQKLALAYESMATTFESLGLSVPESNQAFLDLVASLDLSTEEGRNMWETLMAVAPAFAAVESAAAQAIDTFNGLMGRIRGPGFTANVQRGQLNSELDTFMANNAWTNGMSRDEVMSALLTIAPDDFAAYANKGQGGNINRIFSLWADLNLGDAGGGGGGGGGGTPPDVQALWDMVNAAKRAAEALDALKQSLGDYLDKLFLSNASPLSPMEKLALAQKQFDDLAALAGKGDLDAFGKLTGASDTLLALLAQVYGTSTPEYLSAFKGITDILSGLAGTPDYNERMISAQERQVTLQELVVDILERSRNEAAENAVWAANQITSAIRETAQPAAAVGDR